MSGNPLRFLVVSALATLALVVAACGGSSNSSSSSKTTTKSSAAAGDTPTTAGKKGGKLTMLAASDVDYLDPGHTYYTAGEQVDGAMGRTLYTIGPSDPGKTIPDIAQGDPQISADKKTVTVTLKKGIKFSPPVNREVTSKDIKYAFERFFSVNVGGQYASYFPIVGAPKAPTKGVKTISGITTPDDSTVVFKLQQPVAVSFAAALVMPITTPVPKEYASKFDAKNPSTYNTHVVATGPYMVKNDAQGNTVGYKAGKSIDLVRNPNWDPKTDDRPGYLDEIFIRTNASDPNVSARQVLDGQNMILDTNPPANILKELVTKIKDQYTTVPSGGYRYFPMNTTIKPFDNVDVRRAVIAGFDRNAARLARGGKFVGDIPTHFLPPDFPGFNEAGGYKGPGFDFLKNESGDMNLAAQYMKKAGYPSGKYTGKEQFLMVGANADPGKAQAEVAAAQFQKLGFNMKLRLVPQDAVYTEWCQVPDKKVAVCGGAGWFKDFIDPQSMLEPTFAGYTIAKGGGNNNLAQLNDPKVDAAMKAASLLEGDARNKAWGEIDKMITNDAPAVPFVWDKTTLVRSKNVNGVPNPYLALWDFTYTSIK
ncbi:MAG: peptide/nickel transport system substrate-binding protein [Baekduia sp.]|jgi:peptide/nickel transport system substrate-binding protein|nr:peptide/nickel transport system substrate-binding protein [Baekduia sp.]